MSIPTAAILVIGDEILSGKTEDLNARLLIGELRELGVSLKRICVVPDEVDDVAATIREMSPRFDYVFTSGGVGPTHDDVTLAGIARGFDLPIVRHPKLEVLIRGYFGDRTDDSHLLMANVPEGAELIDGPDIRWPILCVRNVYILPGVPEHFRRKFLAIRERFRVAPFFNHAIFTLEDEFDLADNLRAVATEHPLVAIGSYPNFSSDEYRVKLTLESKDAAALDAAVSRLMDLLNRDKFVRGE